MQSYKKKLDLNICQKMTILRLLQSACYLLGFSVLICAAYTCYLYMKMRIKKRQNDKIGNQSAKNELVFIKVNQHKMIDRCIVVVEDIEPYKKHYHTFRLQV